jgi:hypothetical protein
MIMDGTLGIKLRKKKNEIKIVKEAGTNYTFVDTTVLNLKQEINADSTTNTNSNTEKDLIKTRSMGSRKSKIRDKSRTIGGQNSQSHSSVYE